MKLTPGSGDPSRLAAFEEFFRGNYERVWQYVARRVPLSNVDDVVASTLAVAWKKFGRVEDPSLPWLIRISSYEIENHRRATRRRERRYNSIRVEDVVRTTAPEEFDGSEVECAIARLSKSDREILELVYWDGFSRSEIAEALELKIGAVNVRHHRALQRLRSQLGPRHNAPSGSEGDELSDHSFLKGGPL